MRANSRESSVQYEQTIESLEGLFYAEISILHPVVRQGLVNPSNYVSAVPHAVLAAVKYVGFLNDPP